MTAESSAVAARAVLSLRVPISFSPGPQIYGPMDEMLMLVQIDGDDGDDDDDDDDNDDDGSDGGGGGGADAQDDDDKQVTSTFVISCHRGGPLGSCNWAFSKTRASCQDFQRPWRNDLSSRGSSDLPWASELVLMSRGLVRAGKHNNTEVANRDQKVPQWISICGRTFRHDSLLSPVRLERQNPWLGHGADFCLVKDPNKEEQ